MLAPDEYLTIARLGQGELRIKGSRFFGFAKPVNNEKQANQYRARLKRKYHDATHQPFGYRLANGQERSSDDGEPHGTSGSSILSEIKGANLFDVQVIIVRYFGGTKLGKGGLARAFAECSRLTLENAGRKKARNVSVLTLVLPPEKVNLAKAIAAKFDASVMSLSYDIETHLNLSVPQSRLDECRNILLSRFVPEIFKDKT